MAEAARSLRASTAKGIMNVLYGYVPSLTLLASVNKVADTVKNNREMQLRCFRAFSEGQLSRSAVGTEGILSGLVKFKDIYMASVKQYTSTCNAKASELY